MRKNTLASLTLITKATVLGMTLQISMAYAGGTTTLPSKSSTALPSKSAFLLSAPSQSAPAPVVPADTMIGVLSYGNLSATAASIQAGEGVACFGTFQGSTVVGTMIRDINPTNYTCRYVFAGQVLLGRAGAGMFAPNFWLLAKTSYQWLTYRDQSGKAASVVSLAKADTNATYWQSQKASGQALVVPFVAGKLSSGTKLGLCTVVDQGIRYGGNLIDTPDTAQFNGSALGCVYADSRNQVKVAEPELVLGYLIP